MRWRDGILLTLLIAFLLAGVLYADGRYRSARIAESAAKFQLLGTLRRSALASYFDTARAEVAFWSSSERIDVAMQALQSGWHALGDSPEAQVQRLYGSSQTAAVQSGVLEDAVDGSAYSRAHTGLHMFAREFVVERGYYDFFLIDMDGNIIYSVEKEADFGSNLLTGVYRNTGLADVFQQASASEVVGDVLFSDLQRYAPSADAPAIFAATRLLNAANQPIGVLALQLPSDQIASIMHFTEGMGESGETYLVGEDFLMRSDSRFSDQSTILVTKVETDTVRRALDGENGIEYLPDYRGVPVLSAYDSIEFSDVRWAVMAEIDAEEIDKSVGSIRAALGAAAASLFALMLVTLAAVRDYTSSESAGLAATVHFDGVNGS